jgi:enoyl-CoA hydratase
MTYETLTIGTNPTGIAVLTLNRPRKFNALTDLMFTELHAAIQALETRDDVRAIILTGSGRGFCAGLDLDLAAELPAMPATRFYALQRRWALTKEILQTNMDAPSLAAAIELENRSQALATRTADMTEALAAFREKRAPTFTGA